MSEWQGWGWGVVHTAQLGNWREKSMEEEEEEEGEEVGEGMKAGIQNGGEFFKFAI